MPGLLVELDRQDGEILLNKAKVKATTEKLAYERATKLRDQELLADDEFDKVAGLEAGTDDYVIKPFSPRELIARIKAVLRRANTPDEEVIKAGVLELDTAGHRVLSSGKEIRLGPTEYRLLEFFMSHEGRAYSRSQILDHVWGANAYLEERSPLRLGLEYSVMKLTNAAYKPLPWEPADSLVWAKAMVRDHKSGQ